MIRRWRLLRVKDGSGGIRRRATGIVCSAAAAAAAVAAPTAAIAEHGGGRRRRLLMVIDLFVVSHLIFHFFALLLWHSSKFDRCKMTKKMTSPSFSSVLSVLHSPFSIRKAKCQLVIWCFALSLEIFLATYDAQSNYIWICVEYSRFFILNQNYGHNKKQPKNLASLLH